MEINESGILVLDGWPAVDLESYSSSPDFRGWTEGSADVPVEEQASLILAAMRQQGERLMQIHSRLFIDEGEVLSPTSADALATLIEAGWVRRVPAAAWDRQAEIAGYEPTDDDWRRKAIREFRTVAVSLDDQPTEKAFAGLLYLLGVDFVLIGHTFFYWRDLKLVIYPHENFGIGLIDGSASGSASEQILSKMRRG